VASLEGIPTLYQDLDSVSTFHPTETSQGSDPTQPSTRFKPRIFQIHIEAQLSNVHKELQDLKSHERKESHKHSTMQYHILTLLGGEKMADAPSIAEQSALSDMDDLHDQKSVLTSLELDFVITSQGYKAHFRRLP
jgi:hypothetical protein